MSMKNFNAMRLFVSLLLLSSSFCFTACDDDDETSTSPNEVTTETMFGTYTGKMFSTNVFPSENESSEEGEEKPSGVDISAKVNNDTVYFEKFPIKDIVLSIIPDEDMADKIVEAVGDINYKLLCLPTLTAVNPPKE